MPLSQSFFRKTFTIGATLTCSVAFAQTTVPTMPTTGAAAANKIENVVAASTRKTASGLTIIDRKIGEGPEVVPPKAVLVHYTGWLYDENAPDKKGKKFDSSVDRKMPFGFIVGAKRVIAGWEEGVAGMKKGGQRTLIIPPELGYGASGAGGVIPPNATLIFDIEFIQFAG